MPDTGLDCVVAIVGANLYHLPGRWGVRIEDDVVVTAVGVESLTTYPREWQTVR